MQQHTKPRYCFQCGAAYPSAPGDYCTACATSLLRPANQSQSRERELSLSRIVFNRAASVVLAAVLFILFLLVAIAVATWHETSATNASIQDINSKTARKQTALDQIHHDLANSPVPTLDCLQNPGGCAAKVPAKVAALRASSKHQLAQLEEPLSVSVSERNRIQQLRARMDAFWSSLQAWNPLERWDSRSAPSSKPEETARPQQDQGVMLASLANELDALSRASIHQEQQSIRDVQQRYWSYLRGICIVGFFLIALTAGAGFYRVSHLERVATQEQLRALKAEEELRALTQKVVTLQEDERRQISHELHDEVGQTLTGLRLGLARLGELASNTSKQFTETLNDAKGLAENAMKAIRNIAMLLRPPMLDDLGLEAALRWQARALSMRLGIPVHVDVNATIDSLPERQSTHLYRIAQEALNNSAKHARASEIWLQVRHSDDGVLFTVEDNGIGIRPLKKRTEGLGLLGIEERARELGGRAEVKSRQEGGTRVEVHLP